ncbi:MAG: hypothetical protein ABI787_00810 [Spartobacteria bacterium]
MLIGGFILANGSASKNIVVRAIGPSLSAIIPSALLDPSLQLINSSGQIIASNDDWMTDPNAQLLSDSGLAPTDPLEAAVFTSLNPGSYTVVLPGVDGTQNIALVEVYDLDSLNTPQLQNISTRGSVETADEVMIAGVIVGGANSKALVIRGLGPSLAGAISNPLPNPTLTLFNGFGQQIASNDNWQDTQGADIAATGLAPTNSLEAAILVSLPPAAYTAILSDENGTTGVGLVEIYNISGGP